MKRAILTYCVLCVATLASGQEFDEKGDRHFRQGAYDRALTAYNNAYKRDSSDALLVRIARCEYELGRYDKVIAHLDGVPAQFTLEESDVCNKTAALLHMDRVRQAQDWHLSKDHLVGNARYDQVMKRLSDIQRLQSNRRSNFSISNSVYSTPADEFGLVFSAGNAILVSNALRNHVTLDKTEDQKPYFKIAVQDTSGRRIYDQQMTTPYHNGPVHFWADSLAVVTTVDGLRKRKGKENDLYLKFYHRTEKGWKPYDKMNDGSIGQQTAYGVWRSATEILFASNRAEGQGGWDLYTGVFENETWQVAPLATLNSANNETMPTIGLDGTVYFSSDQPSGFGKLDLYRTTFNGKTWSAPKNLGNGVNSGMDDFLIAFTMDNAGYFSSNRYNGAGGDDIYQFKRQLNPMMISDMRGQFFIEKLKPGAGVELILLNAQNEEVGRTITDPFGLFQFEGLDPDGHYLIKLASQDVELGEQAQMFMVTPQGVKVVKLDKQGPKTFVFTALPTQQVAKLDQLQAEDYDLKVIGINGRIYEKLPGDIIEGLQIAVVDDDGKVLFTTDLLPDGTFSFDKLPADQHFEFRVVGEHGDIQFEILDEYGDVIKTISPNKMGQFGYDYLDPDQLAMELQQVGDESTLIHISINGEIFQTLPGDLPPGIEIMLVDDDGNVIYTTVTDALGRFSFENLPPDVSYTFKLKDLDQDVQMNILDDEFKVTAALGIDKLGQFNYHRLTRDNSNLIQMVDENDEVMMIEPDELFVNYSIFYARDEWKINRGSAHQLDKLVLLLLRNSHVKVTLSSHTDATASDDYNLELSQKRADAAVAYVVDKGVPASRVKGIGYGEQQLVNHCKNGMDCTEEQHKQNRRTEIRISNR